MTVAMFRSAANIWTREEFAEMVQFHLDQEAEARQIMSLPLLTLQEAERIERLVIQNILAHVIPAGSA